MGGPCTIGPGWIVSHELKDEIRREIDLKDCP